MLSKLSFLLSHAPHQFIAYVDTQKDTAASNMSQHSGFKVACVLFARKASKRARIPEMRGRAGE